MTTIPGRENHGDVVAAGGYESKKVENDHHCFHEKRYSLIPPSKYSPRSRTSASSDLSRTIFLDLAMRMTLLNRP